MSKKKKSNLGILLGLLAACAICLTFICFSFSNSSLILFGDEEMEIDYLDDFEDPGAAGKIKLFPVKVEGSIDSSKLGTQALRYSYLNVHKTRTVTIVDNEPPIIVLNGSLESQIIIGRPYVEEGYVASDNYDGDLTNKVAISGEVDTSTPGKYTLTYTVSDSSGNGWRETRQVEVVDYQPLDQSLTEFDLTPLFPDTILAYTDEDTTEKYNNLTLFGDSIFLNLEVYGIIPHTNRIWARSSMTPDNIYTRVINVAGRDTGTNFYEILAKYKPEHLLIYYGTDMSTLNSISYYTEAFEKALIKMKEVSPDTHFIFCSLLPRAEKYQKTNYGTDKMNKINYYVCQLCEKYDCHFMNVAEAFKDENGWGNDKFISTDGIHPNKAGCELLIDYIKHHLSY